MTYRVKKLEGRTKEIYDELEREAPQLHRHARYRRHGIKFYINRRRQKFPHLHFREDDI